MDKNPTKQEILKRFEELNFEIDKQKHFVASCPNSMLLNPIQELANLFEELSRVRSSLTIEDLN
jgi:hypothetical protein